MRRRYHFVAKRAIGVLFLLILASSSAEVGAVSYQYLPKGLNEPLEITFGEFAAVRLTAYYNCPGNLTSKLMRQSVRCYLGPESVDLFVDTICQPSWDTHIGDARFSVGDDEVAGAYQEAGPVPMTWLTRFFPGTPEDRMRVIFMIRGYQIGIYQNGKFTIAR